MEFFVDLNQIIPRTAKGSTVFFWIIASIAAKPVTLLTISTAPNTELGGRYLFTKEQKQNVENQNLTRCTSVSSAVYLAILETYCRLN